ncbi:hypothetical protein F3Y33_24850 (plasmid) [Rhizobium sp. BG6]|uniref:hypothetical protein n=1 Tax=Rhizobium sp. BG6 TaxID=2613771 RepID=UPI00193DF241|nr:hypothetical protein [Rhizobium sp. BG6]QRM52455.1 hypothetical protein F3Y33_24850 [Rhizobium sp. BG6]
MSNKTKLLLALFGLALLVVLVSTPLIVGHTVAPRRSDISAAFRAELSYKPAVIVCQPMPWLPNAMLSLAARKSGNATRSSMTQRNTFSILTESTSNNMSRDDIYRNSNVQRDTKIVLATVIGSVLVCAVCFVFWMLDEPYKPNWEFPSETHVTD